MLAPERLAQAHPRWTEAHARESAVVAGALVWPAVSVGPVFDSNPYQQHRAGRGAAGFAIAPTLLAERRAGLGRTEVYAAGEAHIFPDGSAPDTVNGRAGVLQDWRLRPDLTVRLQGEVARRTDPFNTASLVSGSAARGLVFESDALGAASVQKTFDRVFVSVSGTALRATYADSSRFSADRLRFSPETVTTVKSRVGYLLASGAFVFAEPAADWRALDRLARDSSGTRAVAGIGLARFGLLGGEFFAGWQSQSYPFRGQAVSTPVAGGRLVWSPTRIWTVTAQYDQSLGEVAVGTAIDPLGTATRTDAVLLSVDWAATPLWTVRAAGGAIWVDYIGTSRADPVLGSKLRKRLGSSLRVFKTLILWITLKPKTLASDS